MNKIIVIGSDHAGYLLKVKLIDYLTSNNYKVIDEGTYSLENVDYPDYAHKVASKVNKNLNYVGVLICGSGIGVSIVANRYENVRCALCWNSEIAKLSRQHNDANIIALPARFIDDTEAIKCLNVFFNTEFEKGRHLLRLQKINNKII
ncbi:MAG: ribose 5-phosphate isomerase B [Bacteroidales bacterium]|nr:ribose 5-phosphate isomerase B [Bacteroidales bacterium]